LGDEMPGMTTEIKNTEKYKIEKKICPECGKREVWTTLRRPPGNPFVALMTVGVITIKQCFNCGWKSEL
jgi:hypothetical protein